MKVSEILELRYKLMVMLSENLSYENDEFGTSITGKETVVDKILLLIEELQEKKNDNS
jgi:hypothetical protein